MKPVPHTALLFQNVSIAVFDAAGQQLPELQTCLLFLWAEDAERNGYHVDGLVVECSGGEKWQLRKTPEGWNRLFLGS